MLCRSSVFFYRLGSSVRLLGARVMTTMGAFAIAVIICVDIDHAQTVGNSDDDRSGFEKIIQMKEHLRQINGRNSAGQSLLTTKLPSEKIFSPESGEVDPSFNPNLESYPGSIRSSV